MALNEREQIHHQLLDALYTAKKQVEYLEAALAHNAAYLGTGVERDGQFGVKPEDMVAPDALIRYLELVEPESDISDYLGSEGVEHTRPRLGPDAPEFIRPNKQPPINPQVSILAMGHPDDRLAFPFSPGALPPGTYVGTQAGEVEQEEQHNGPENENLSASEATSTSEAVSTTGSAASPSLLVENVPTPGDGGSAASPAASDSSAATTPATASLPVDSFAVTTPEAASPAISSVAAPATDARGRENVDARQFAGEDRETLKAAPSVQSSDSKSSQQTVQQRPVTDEDCLRAHNAMQALGYGIWDWNLRTGKIFISSRWEEMLGVPPQNLPSALDTLTCAVHADDAAPLRDAFIRLQTSEAVSVSMSVRFRTKDGVFISGRMYLACQRMGDKPSRITAVLAENQGDDHEVRLDGARLAALYRLARMEDSSEDSVVNYCLREAVRLTGSEFGYLYLAPRPGGKNGNVHWFSSQLTQTGKEPASPDFSGTLWNDQAEGLLEGPKVVDALEGVMEKAFGGTVAVNRYILMPIMEEGRVVCIAAVANKEGSYDSSDKRQLELFINGMWFYLRKRWAVEELHRAKEAAEAASRAKNEFLANISHELRTPLNGILGMLQVLQQSELTDRQIECVCTAIDSGRSLVRIISDILDFARIEAGVLELNIQPFDFGSTVRSTIGLFMHEAGRRGLEFTLSLDDKIPHMVMGDEARVRQILFNLVGNSFKFTEHGSIRVECSLLPVRKGGRLCLYLAVHDTGIGISDERLREVFQNFTQLDSSSTRRYAGSGIGLSIVRRLIQCMGGSITIESVLGEGTSLHCVLPFDEAHVSTALPEVPVVPLVPVRPLHILAVEDDPVNQYTLRTLLKKSGHRVACVSNGRQAIEILKLRHFECVITDIQMPIMDGEEFVRRIRTGDTGDVTPSKEMLAHLGMEDGPELGITISNHLPIIALTAHALKGDEERFLSMGVDYYLSKPIISSELERVLAYISHLVHSA